MRSIPLMNFSMIVASSIREVRSPRSPENVRPTLLGGDSAGRCLKGDAKPVGVRNREIELFKTDDSSGEVFHEHDYIARLLAHVFLVRVAEPDSKRPALTIVEHAHFNHIRIPS